MISFTIHDTKEFMHLLLKQNTFDNFCIYRMDITTFALFQIDGYKNKAYFSPAEQELITEHEWDKWVLELFQKLKIAIITQ